MIRNARQYRITHAQLAKLDQAVAHLDLDWHHHVTQRWAARPVRLVYD